MNRYLTTLATLTLIASGLFSTPAAADLEVVAVMALQPLPIDKIEVFGFGADKQAIASAFANEINKDLDVRLADEFESALRSADLASAFSEQILDALDERLPGEVGNLIAATH
ncbi:MAG: hypothetical protein AB8G18_05385 [Gammaproteobacteria bacterium]